MKALAAELKGTQIDDKTHELSVQQQQNVINELRRDLCKQKKDNMRLKERIGALQQSDDAPQFPIPSTNAYKTLGCGYRIPTSAHSDFS